MSSKAVCQSALKIDPVSASKIDPPLEGIGRAPGERCAERMRSAAASPEGALEVLIVYGSDAVFEAPAFVTGFDNVTMMRETVKECGCHFGIAED